MIKVIPPLSPLEDIFYFSKPYEVLVYFAKAIAPKDVCFIDNVQLAISLGNPSEFRERVIKKSIITVNFNLEQFPELESLIHYPDYNIRRPSEVVKFQQFILENAITFDDIHVECRAFCFGNEDDDENSDSTRMNLSFWFNITTNNGYNHIEEMSNFLQKFRSDF